MQRRPVVTYPRILVVVLCAIFALNMPALAQVVGATVSGILTDPGGRVVPDAKITLTNTEQGTERTIVSNHEGAYTMPNVAAGAYDIKVEAAGFRTEVKRGLRLTVGEQPTVNFSLVVASLDTSVLVEDTTSQIDVGNSALSNVVSGETIRELPLNGRDWTQMATLEPGTATIRSQPTATNSSSRGNRGFGQQLTIAGGRPQLNTYRIDGINVNDYSNSSPGSSAGLSLGADAIGEFSVISSNYSATYGVTAGGVINAITRAGTNKIHGSAYEFVRNDYFDAESYTDTTKLPFRRNQFGGTLGGPVIKNHTFLFGNYEGLRQVYSTTSLATVPSLNARNGILVCSDLTAIKATTGNSTLKCDANGTTYTLPNGVDPKVQPYLAVWHVPTGTVTGDTAVYGFASKQFTPENFFTIRGDQIFSQKDSMYVTYLYDNGTTVQPDTLNFNNQTNSAARQMLSVSENHVFNSNVYNSLRVGANRVVAASLIKTPGANPLGSSTSLGAVSGLDAPLIAVGSGVTSFTGGVVGGSAVHYGFTTPQLTDDVFITKGQHQLKFGFSVERIQSNILIASFNYGSYTFTSLANFLLNYPSKLSIATTPPTAIDLRQSVYGAYAEDSWKVRPTLILTAGVRYEPVQVPTETKGRLANLTSISGTVVTGSPLFANPTYKNFEPRVGFNYSPPATNGKTSISGGYGIFDVLPLTWMFNLQLSQVGPYSLNLSTVGTPPQGSFPSGLVTTALNGSGAPAQSYIPQNPPTNYVQQYNIAFQQELPGKIHFKVGYVGSHGVHQDMYTSDANVPQPLINTPGQLVFPCGTTGLAYQTCPTGSNTKLKVNQNVGAILGSGWFTSSNYNGLLTDIKQDIGKSFHWQASFTWQKSMDGSSSVVSGTPFSNSLNQFLFHPLRGVSDYNIPHVFVANAIWKTPKLVRSESPLAYVANGWEVSGIYQIADGTPFSVVIAGDNLALGNGTPLDFPNRLTGGGCSGNPVNSGNRQAYIKTACFALPPAPTNSPGTQFGNEQRNSLRGPDFQEMDMSFAKSFFIPSLGEGRYLQFRADAFNIANHPNLSPPYTTNSFTVSATSLNGLAQNTGPGSASNVGSITTVSGSPRQIQLAAKLVF